MPHFSEAFGIDARPEDDWFDPILESDTTLFVDPFLISDDDDPYWQNAYEGLIEFFNATLKLVAASGGDKRSAAWKRAAQLLSFKEPAEFALGYGDHTILGAGIGHGIGDAVLRTAHLAIRAGLDEVQDLNELLLLGDNIGPDRIGDLVCNILKASFIEYTQRVAKRHAIETTKLPVTNASWHRDELRWIDRYVNLPRNPNFPSLGVLLTPQRFLRRLPTVDIDDFWDWAWLHYGEDLKLKFNYQISTKADRAEIMRLARYQESQLWLEYVRSREKEPYDIRSDPQNVRILYDGPPTFAALSTFTESPATPDDFCSYVGSLIHDFKWIVEDRRGWEILWSGRNPRNERTCQTLFESSLILVCRRADIDMSRESDTGTGPVDFKMSQGWERRALIELKRAQSSSLRPNVKFQLPQYLKSEAATCGYLVIAQFFEEDTKPEKMDWIRGECARVSAETGKNYEPVFIDARNQKPSASTIRS
jgi:hypothetical protein